MNQPQLIYTRGLPGSGKTTWAKQYVEDNPNSIYIELDMLREKYNIDPRFPDKEMTKKIVKERNEIVLKALAEGKTVICSDTNLTKRAINGLRELSRVSKVLLVLKDFTDIPVEVCIERDNKRKKEGLRYVGKEVILSLYLNMLKQ